MADSSPAPSAPSHPPDATPSVYLIAAHPDWNESRVNRRLLEAARSVADSQGIGAPRVDIQDLYATYADYCIDVPAEQARVAAAQLIVLMHPIQWYAMPALQKLWLDDVLTYGWAYGAVSSGTGDNAAAPANAPGTALRGKDLWLVATTGGQEESYHPESYNRYYFDAFLPPYEQTASLCGMRFLPPLILHGAHSVGRDAVVAHVESFRQHLQTYPAWAGAETLAYEAMRRTGPGIEADV
ncbi:NAD(P)H dehydrogenase [Rhodoferax koreense]|uniref:NAD(P)H dehydrogenase n=1 Tax=Rhodoferax koreensis TaxID=1842727 RepID=A0A1P8K1I2_9BURK|nr:NAD(P)H-dependent oxidoreductase [Rhodoferax koreense]APW39801.1 NAD(P)H dehydrogenase [Rhodoferax koreense]